MTFQDKIRDTVLKAKNYIGCLANSLIEREKYGDKIECSEIKMVLLANMIETLEFHYCFNYDENGTITEPEYECLSYEQSQGLVGNINKLMK